MPTFCGRPVPPLLLHPELEERARSQRKAPAPGPARAVVTIPYEVDAPPSVLMLRRRQAFADDVLAEHLGKVIEQRGGHGTVEIVIDVLDAAVAHKPLQTLLRKNGFEWALIQYTPAADASKVPVNGAPAPGADSSSPAPAGPARALVTIPYEGDDLPPIPLVRQRQAFANAVREQRLGEVTDQGGGGGIMEVEIEVPDAARSHSGLLRLLREHGLEHATVEYAAV
ncbi:MAG: hypothetical protein ACRELB_18380 [Polyangiaceae bacterium]